MDLQKSNMTILAPKCRQKPSFYAESADFFTNFIQRKSVFSLTNRHFHSNLIVRPVFPFIFGLCSIYG